ncbi:MAG: molybdopterin cofactor-binding domain-containing protein [Pseudomonadota bacterium]
MPSVSRRRFIVGGGFGLGLAIGFVLTPRNPPLDMIADADEVVVNAWLKLGKDGSVRIIVPHNEIGQGIETALAQILVEELDADWDMVKVEQAIIHPFYVNKALVEDAAKLDEKLPKMFRGTGHFFLSELVEIIGLQMTGGSSSVRNAAGTMREAGAAARHMLIKAAAKRLDVPELECVAARGVIIHAPSNRRLGFGMLAEDAAKLRPPSRLRMKDTTNYRLVGQPVTRLDARDKAAGKTTFGLDVRLPAMAYAAIIQGPTTGGTVLNVNLPDDQDWPANDVRVVRQRDWVAVVAKTYWRARTYADATNVTFNARGSHIDDEWIAKRAQVALEEEPGHIYKATRARPLPLVKNDQETDEDLERGFLSASYQVPYLAHACLEPINCTALATRTGCELWLSTQAPSIVRRAVAHALEIEESEVRVNPTFAGGGFGRRLESEIAVQAALVSLAIKRPVQAVWSREDDMTHDVYRPASWCRVRAKLGEDGLPVAMTHKLLSQAAAGGYMGRHYPAQARIEPDPTSVEGVADTPYDFGRHQVRHVVDDILVPVGFWRSVGHSFNAFFVESFVDEMAHKAGKDPVSYRRELLAKHPRDLAVLDRLVEVSGYARQRLPGRSRGIAIHRSFGSVVAQSIEIRLTGSGGLELKKVWCVIDCGPTVNPDIVRQQMEGGIIFGLTAALYGEINFQGGTVEQQNFDGYPLLSLGECPDIDIEIMPHAHGSAPYGGVGEPGVPPIAPALANAIFNATGKRIRRLPIANQNLFPDEVAKS